MKINMEHNKPIGNFFTYHWVFMMDEVVTTSFHSAFKVVHAQEVRMCDNKDLVFFCNLHVDINVATSWAIVKRKNTPNAEIRAELFKRRRIMCILINRLFKSLCRKGYVWATAFRTLAVGWGAFFSVVFIFYPFTFFPFHFHLLIIYV